MSLSQYQKYTLQHLVQNKDFGNDNTVFENHYIVLYVIWFKFIKNSCYIRQYYITYLKTHLNDEKSYVVKSNSLHLRNIVRTGKLQKKDPPQR